VVVVIEKAGIYSVEFHAGDGRATLHVKGRPAYWIDAAQVEGFSSVARTVVQVAEGESLRFENAVGVTLRFIVAAP
jgi:hypothetical protein